MSYAELRRGPLSFFNDIMWTAVEAADGFERRFVSGQVEVDYSQLTVELGAAYSVWSESGGTVDVLAGGRYWRQETDVYLQTDRVALDRSGTVDWVDPFVGARWMQSVAPGQSILVRGDIGGFGAGSDFSWQALATYNLKLCETDGHTINGYVGYRALTVDYCGLSRSHGGLFRRRVRIRRAAAGSDRGPLRELLDGATSIGRSDRETAAWKTPPFAMV